MKQSSTSPRPPTPVSAPWSLAPLLLLLAILAGCGSEEPLAPLAATATPPLQPTPTLVEALQRDGGTAAAAADLQPTATPTLSPTNTPLPPPETLLPLASRSLEVGDTDSAQADFQGVLASADVQPEERAAAFLGLARTALEEGDRLSAAAALTDYLANAADPDPAAYFLLATVSDDPAAAAGHYRAYLAANPDMGAYVYPRLATLEPAAADASLLAALEADAHYLVHFGIHRELARIYISGERYDEAIGQYAAMRDLARTENTKGEMTYLIGQTLAQTGNLTGAYQAYQLGISTYPRSYQSYLGLVELVNAEQPVDQFQRGLVNFYAQSYSPAVIAFQNVLNQPGGYRPDTHLFLAWSYEGLGDFANALDQLDRYRRLDPTNDEVIGRYYEEKAALETRSVSVGQAIETLQAFARVYPNHPRVPWALWRAAVLADRFRQDREQALTLYENFVTTFPNDENSSDALFRSGMLHYQGEAVDEAIEAWKTASSFEDEAGRASLVWLIRTADPESTAGYRTLASIVEGADYYSLRARDLGQDLPPYAPVESFDLSFDEAAGRAEVEAWLRERFAISPEVPVSSDLPAELAADPRLVRGQKLWALGLKEDAKRELEAIREQYAQNAVTSYQLALFFRDLGLFRSSILAAEAVLIRAGATVFDTPPLIGRLAYPTYYADLILPLAEEYGYDPLLQFALIRQESLYESFIASSAAAQGLSQVIPDTGIFIAQRLQWPDYKNEDLYRPFINLRFGAYYLDQQLELFEDAVAPALAAYNAGPGNAIRWHEIAGSDHDLYLETVNFAETRLYIRRIYVGHAVYRFLYGE